jgi:type I restriction enzyme, R subunit
MKEAAARIKINKLLEAAGWRFFPEGKLPANIQLEPKVTIKISELDALGNDFEKTAKGFIDFLLLDSRGFPLIVLEAKAEDKSPLVGKEQARKYARSQNPRSKHSPRSRGR